MHGRFCVEVLTTSGRAAGVEFWVRPDTVEIWHHRRKVGVLDRQRLGGWLAEPADPLEVNMVSLTVNDAPGRSGLIAITLPDVENWTLSPTSVAELRSLVAAP